MASSNWIPTIHWTFWNSSSNWHSSQQVFVWNRFSLGRISPPNAPKTTKNLSIDSRNWTKTTWSSQKKLCTKTSNSIRLMKFNVFACGSLLFMRINGTTSYYSYREETVIIKYLTIALQQHRSGQSHHGWLWPGRKTTRMGSNKPNEFNSLSGSSGEHHSNRGHRHFDISKRTK